MAKALIAKNVNFPLHSGNNLLHERPQIEDT